MTATWMPSSPGDLARQQLDGVLHVVEAELVRLHLLERELARLDQLDRVGVAVGVHREGALHRERLVDQHVGGDRDVLVPLQPGQHDGAAPADRVDRVEDRLLRHRGQVEHHVHPVAAGQLADPRDRVLLVHVDHVVGAELARQLELLRVAGQAGGDDQPRADVPGGEDGGQAALARAEHQHRGPEVHAAVLQRPAHARRPSGLYMTAISAGMSFLTGCTIEFGCRCMYSA